jgi:hypothetical protein
VAAWPQEGYNNRWLCRLGLDFMNTKIASIMCLETKLRQRYIAASLHKKQVGGEQDNSDKLTSSHDFNAPKNELG